MLGVLRTRGMNESRRWIAISLVAPLALSLTACGDDTPAVPPVDLDTFPSTSPVVGPCSNRTADALPVLALERDRSRDTFIALGATPTELAIDYDVSPRARVDRVELGWDWDRIGVPAPLSVARACPSSLTFAEVSAPLDAALTEEIFSARVVATGDDGDRREGRLSFARGTGTLVVRTEGLDAGRPEQGDWWLLLEPAHGNARVLLAPARLDRATLRVVGVPLVPGEVALVQTSRLEANATGTVYAPAGFGQRWRELVTGWYGRVLAEEPTPERVVDLDRILAPGSMPLAIRDLTAGTTALDATEHTRFAATSVHELATALSVPCPTDSLALTVLGYSDLTVTDPMRPQAAGPGERIVIPVSCAAGATMATVPIGLVNLNGRRAPIRIERVVTP